MGRLSSLKLLAAFGLLLVIVTTAPERIGVIPKEWLIERLTVAEAEARRTVGLTAPRKNRPLCRRRRSSLL